MGDEVAIGSAAAISKVAISNGHCNGFLCPLEKYLVTCLSKFAETLSFSLSY